MELLLLAHAGATLFMVGLIWFVQIVHYPLFARVGRQGFVAYSEAHSRLTSREWARRCSSKPPPQ